MFVVLQPGGPINSNLKEAFVQTISEIACGVLFPGAFTNNTICAGSYSIFSGPCDVRIL